MRIVPVDELTEDMKLVREIIDPESGRVLLGAGASGLARHAKRLRGIGINYVSVDDPLSEGIVISPVVSDEIRQSAEIALNGVFEKFELDQSAEYAPVKETVKEIIREILSHPDILISVNELRSRGGDFLGHSVNVAVLSLIVGTQLGYDADKMKKLGIGAMLHDIGVAGMPRSLLANRRGLSVEEKLLYEQHPLLGYHRVKDSWEISPLSRGVILSHHERSDGSGYPHRLLKGDIHEFSRIVGLVDCFEELTGGHPFSQEMNIQGAIELLVVKGEDWFDRNLVKEFCSRIPLCQTGSTVRLNDGRTAIVISQNKGFPTRPVLRIYQNADGTRIDPAQELDLLFNNHLVIQ